MLTTITLQIILIQKTHLHRKELRPYTEFGTKKTLKKMQLG